MPKSKKSKKPNKWIQGDAKHVPAVKHPGAVKNAAKKHGKSTLSEAKSESKSPDKKIAARGRLALRFMGKAKHGNIRKKGQKRGSRKRISSKS
jgi:hypothetical protein